MRLRVRHTTTFTYDAPIVEAYTELRMRPMDVDGQRCLSFQVTTEPRGVRIHTFTDHLGNWVGHFDVLEPHEQLTVTATSEVATSAYDDHIALSLLERHDYLRSSPSVVIDRSVSRFAERSVSGTTGAEKAASLMQAVRDALVYEKGATSVQTPAAEVLALGRGVCQDFAHVLIAACRHIGVPARYVSGYFYDEALGDDHGESHAWVDAWDDDRGWISLDPTHDTEQNESYVRVAVGRDYSDVPPTRGVFKGAAEEVLRVQVHLRPLTP